MALYRLHKVEWEQQIRQTTEAWKAKIKGSSGGPTEPSKLPGRLKRELANEDEDGEQANQLHGEKKERKRKKTVVPPGGGRKGISSGLGVIVRRNGQRSVDDGGKRTNGSGVEDIATGRWWEEPAG